jgi:hypothetical protein
MSNQGESIRELIKASQPSSNSQRIMWAWRSDKRLKICMGAQHEVGVIGVIASLGLSLHGANPTLGP